jgi:hypothetical protein
MSFGKMLRESFGLQVTAVIAALVVTASAGYLAGCWDYAKRVHASVYLVEQHEVTISKMQVQQQDTADKVSKQLEQILGEIKSVKKEQISQNVLTGLAIRLNCCRGDTEPWVRVNALSPAIRFTEGEKLKVTTRTREELTTEVIVKGTFRAENPQYLLQLNGVASEELRLGRLTEVGVMVRESN